MTARTSGAALRASTPPVLEWAAVALLVAAPFAFVVWTGALSVPYLDDWAYLRIVRDHVLTGEFRFIDWNDVNFLGLVPFTWMAGKLLGTSTVDFKAVSVLAYVALVAGIIAYVRMVVTRRWWAMASAAVLVYPPFGYLAVTLMTDLPSIACQVWCIVLGLASLPAGRKARPGLLVLALAVGLLGFTIRQQAGVAPLAVVCLLGVRALAGRERRLAALATCGLAACAVGFTLWRATFPLGGHSLSSSGLTDGTGSLLMLGVFTAGFALPVLLLATGRTWPALRRPVLRLGASTVLAVGAVGAVLRLQEFPFRGNGVTRYGAMGGHWSLAGGRDPVYPLWLWLVVLACFTAGTSLSVLLLWHGIDVLRHGRRGASREPITGRLAAARPTTVVLLGVTVATVALLVVNAYVNFFVFDRYAAPLFIFLLPLLVAWATGGDSEGRARRSLLPVATGLLALLAVVSLGGTWDAQSFAAARWQAGNRAVALGYPAGRVDAGAEWVGYHYRHLLQEKAPAPPADGLPASTYRAIVPRLRRSLVVLDQPVPGRRPVLRVRYSEWFGLSHRQLIGYRVEPP